MTDKKTLTLALMDAPFESARTATAFRVMDIAVSRGYNLNVFAYEGAVMLPFSEQAPHPNALHGNDADAENHPLPKDWIAGLLTKAAENGAKLDWVNCGLCVDERGAGAAIDGVRRGTPADFWAMAEASDNTLVIATK